MSISRMSNRARSFDLLTSRHCLDIGSKGCECDFVSESKSSDCSYIVSVFVEHDSSRYTFVHQFDSIE